MGSAALLPADPLEGSSEQHSSRAYAVISAMGAAQVKSGNLEGGEMKEGWLRTGVGRVPQAERSASHEVDRG